MTIHRNDYGNLRAMPPSVGRSGVIMEARFSHTFTAAGGNIVAASDILEIGHLPAGCIPTDAWVYGEGFSTDATCDVGFMTGDIGADANPDGSPRTCGAELFNDAPTDDDTAVATQRADKFDLLAIAASPKNRSIGVKFSGNETADGSQTITVVVQYMN